MMAARKKKHNVSNLIRQYLSENPDGKPAEIQQHLSETYNIDISAAYISTIKSITKRQQEIASADPSIQRLYWAKQFCESMGGVEEAVRMIEVYRRLLDP